MVPGAMPYDDREDTPLRRRARALEYCASAALGAGSLLCGVVEGVRALAG